jgi:hypothetical protein
MVDEVMQLGCVPLLVGCGYFQDLIAGISKLLQSEVNFSPHFWYDLKFAFNRQNLHLNLINFHPCFDYTQHFSVVPEN